MKIKIYDNLYINSNTLVRIEWKRFYPVLIVHEKFEKPLKWILRIIAFIGIFTSVISIPVWYLSLGLAIIIALIEQFFEKAIFEYTTMVVQPFPEFEIQYEQWKTNGFMIPNGKYNNDLAHFGPTYADEEYATKIFKYFTSWIDNSSNDDIENNLIVSIVIEPDQKYTTYIYANFNRKRLNKIFKYLGNINRYKKKGKRQQQFINQMIYWNILAFKDGYLIKKFLEFQNDGDPFFFTPSVIQPFELPPKYLTELSIKKYHLKVKNREELLKNEIEYHFKPTKKERKEYQKVDVINKVKSIDVIDQIQQILSKAVDVGFMPNIENSVGVIHLCYNGDCVLEFEAYKQLIEQSDNKELILRIIEFEDYIDILVTLTTNGRNLYLNKLPYNKTQLEEFVKVNGGGKNVALLIGYPPANERKMILEKDMSPMVITWDYSKN